MTDQPAAEPPDEAVEGGFRLRRNAARGFAVGAVVAAATFGFFVWLPGLVGSTGFYVGLAVVLGVSVGMLVTIVLVAWRTRRLARTL